MANKKKPSNVKPEVGATPVVKVDPVTDNTPDAPIAGAETVETSGKPDETPEETPGLEAAVKLEDDLMTVQVGEHTIQITKDPDGDVTEEDKANAVDAEWILDKLAPYFDAYPTEKEFHITSDGQVFLKPNKPDAEAHQKFLNDGKELLSFTVEN